LNRIEVIRGRTSKKGEATQGITRDKGFEADGVLVGRSRIGPGVESDWHHHAKRNVYGFIVAGRLRLDYGRTGKHSTEARAGDFFFIPAGLVHRDVNPDSEEVAVVVNVMLGKGPAVINVSLGRKRSRNEKA